MRLNRNFKPASDGDIRIVKRFCFWPHIFNDSICWLEFIKLEQIYDLEIGWRTTKRVD